MSILTRHQHPKVKLPRVWKFFLALLCLVLLIVFKDLPYNLEKNEQEQARQNPSVFQNDD